MRILVVEDDRDLCELMALNLAAEGYAVDTCGEGDDALRLVRERCHDLILLDRMLPGLDGLTLLQTARREGISTPVLMITALGDIPRRVEGLDGGADDYLVKPFSLEELLARVRAVARRPREMTPPGELAVGGVRLDAANLRLHCGEAACELSRRECDLLEMLLRHPGKTLPRASLLGYVWGPHAAVEPGNLDNYIHYARERLAAVGSPLVIRTVRGVGYRLEEAGV